MNNKFFRLFIIIAALAILYYVIPKGTEMIALSYCVMLAGLYCERFFRGAAFAGSLLASFIIIKYAGGHVFVCVASIILFLSVIPIPYYFMNKTKKEEKELSAENAKLKERHTDILAENFRVCEKRKKYEDNIERIMQLYIIGRDLSKNVYMEDYADTVLRAISGRAGVINVSVFMREKGTWKPLAFSKLSLKEEWVKYMSDNKYSVLEKESGCVMAAAPAFCAPEESVVFWPLKIEHELLGCILLTVEKEYVSCYVEEGAIFGPQIALGARRVNLFAEMSERSRNDGLTGLYLKRYFMERLRSEIQREKRYAGGFYLIMLDIDYFKKVNDKYGHLTGDKVLCAIAKILVDCVRPGDLVGRYGGEEFIVFMPMATQYAAKTVAQEINNMVKNKKFHENGENFNVTISAGISSYPKDGQTIDQIIEAADTALYSAKEKGRNSVVLYGR
ncbi:MAG: GGDEF domain-containing protein [Endomicrobium sp.]|jgi:diguanylate cyclase (GGDEF)-like protein|nr:GGDEF domain-containing protein [Endomicrobium sp.]